ncbi:class I SAM-dependent methyltransferase [Paralcaligenes ureilyticus]|uniref:SAM-dependent MidA family methyltransferase n=1 Tax=Paralcaligenes ureilyticus TaxID=627131 RepID=A0A4R3M6W7_9BURK|nr:SAM-dependent methyltransferase [Paralcaligenes ureilyticus]TCT07307.1 SAM-dependent MidA family methyltransferase [Paralcaligenes ureilyticus]
MTINQHPATPTGLPALEPVTLAHQQAMQDHLIQTIEQASLGFMPFEQWMNLALYAPGLGYYAAGSSKFASDLPNGDFTTAPELTPLFGQVLARQAAQILKASESPCILEFGAGSGALAAAVIAALREMGIDPHYQILEISADLRTRQQQRLAEFGASVTWLDSLPEAFSGCVLANEVLDAMPATLFQWGQDEQLYEVGVSLSAINGDTSAMTLDQSTTRLGYADRALHDAEPGASRSATPFIYVERLAPKTLQEIVAQRMPPLAGYRSEINRRAEGWVRQMGEWLERGAALLIDYGFPQREYYHPQRASGTLMCHFRHHAHGEPLIHPGLQDITTHVDFTAMADAALAGGLDVLGYTSQARFLMNAGLPDLLSGMDAENAKARAKTMASVQKLVAETEMGELFKVLAIGRGMDDPLMGFALGDRRDRL